MIKPFFYILGVVVLIAATVAFVAPSLSKDIWVEQAKLGLPKGLEYFGQDIAIDGDTAVVGARGYRLPNNHYYRGTAFVYTYSGNTWSEQAKLFLPQTQRNNYNSFGSSVAIDGDTILVAANSMADDDPHNVPLFVFSRKGNTWSLQAQLRLPHPPKFSIFINTLALKGNTVVAGTSEGPLVFRRHATSGIWSYEATLSRPLPSNTQCNNPYFGGSYYGNNVGIDDNTIIVSGGGRVNCPYAYVFVREEASGSWLLQAELTPHPREVVDKTAVALSGNTAVIGFTADFVERGAAYVYERDITTGNWSKQAKLVPNDVPPLLTYGFGASVAIDANTIVVGSNRYAIRGFLSPSKIQKAAYVFVRPPGKSTWSQPVKLIPRDYNQNVAHFYGQKVDVSGERVIVNVGNSFNIVYIFQRVNSQKSAN